MDEEQIITLFFARSEQAIEALENYSTVSPITS